MRLMFYLPKLFFSNFNFISFKIVSLGSYTLMETLFPLSAAALEIFNRYGLQHIRYCLLNVFFYNFTFPGFPFTRCGRKLMKLMFYLPKFFYFFKHRCYPLQNSSLGQLHTNGDIVLTFGSSSGSLQQVWSSAYPLHSFGCFLKS